ncbi:MAG: biotin/lipoyl-binding protein, partial [Sphingomonas sp.]
MNYETGSITQERLPGVEAPPSRRKFLIAAIVVAVLAVVGWAVFGRGESDGAAKTASGEQLAAISVMVPGRTVVARDVTTTGSLAARRDMPVGIAGEGGLVTRVLVEPGQWVAAGQVLATVDRSVQTQTAASLAAQVSVA